MKNSHFYQHSFSNGYIHFSRSGKWVLVRSWENTCQYRYWSHENVSNPMSQVLSLFQKTSILNKIERQAIHLVWSMQRTQDDSEHNLSSQRGILLTVFWNHFVSKMKKKLLINHLRRLCNMFQGEKVLEWVSWVWMLTLFTKYMTFIILFSLSGFYFLPLYHGTVGK